MTDKVRDQILAVRATGRTNMFDLNMVQNIANEMNFKKPSVSVAMKNLRENGYITVSPEGYIHLTESGLEVAEKIYERHTILSNWLTMLGVDPRVAAEDACKIEHDVSAESFEAIKRHINSSAGKI